MLLSLIIKILLIICFLFFGYNITYIIKTKRKNKRNINNSNKNYRVKESTPFSRFGVLCLNIFIILVSLNIFIYNYWKDVLPSILLPYSEIFQVVGFTLVIGGNITLLLAYHELGIYWAYPFDGVHKEKKLVTTGIYSKIRHPIYLSFNLFCIGFNLMLLDYILLILYIIGAFGLYFQALNEEKGLMVYFGEDYINYMENTGRFFLKINKKQT